MLVNNFFQDVPNLWVATLEHAAFVLMVSAGPRSLSLRMMKG